MRLFNLMPTLLAAGGIFGGAVMGGCSSGGESVSASASAESLGIENGLGFHCSDRTCDDAFRGLRAFVNREVRGGNGRACADCHMPGQAFALTPAAAKARYDFLQARKAHDPDADDPLFRPIDADDFRTNGANASDYSNLTQNGLIRVTLKLPDNIKLLDPVTGAPLPDTFADVWRAVPSVLNVAITGVDGQNPMHPLSTVPEVKPHPNRTGGFQWDARFATLQEQAFGAFTAHAQVPDALVDPKMLDDLATFQETLFSSRGVRQLAVAMETSTTPFPDPDRQLTALEQQGKAIFLRACGTCHGDNATHPSQSTPIIFEPTPGFRVNRYHPVRSGCGDSDRVADTVTPPRWQFAPCPDRVRRNVQKWQVTTTTAPGVQTVKVFSSDDPGVMLLTGDPNDEGLFDPPQLRGLANSAPYYHNNSVETLDEVLDLYVSVFARLTAVLPKSALLTTDGIHQDRPFTPDERPALIAYLKAL